MLRHLETIRANTKRSLLKVTEVTLKTDEWQRELRLVINEILGNYDKKTMAPIEEVQFTELIIQWWMIIAKIFVR